VINASADSPSAQNLVLRFNLGQYLEHFSPGRHAALAFRIPVFELLSFRGNERVLAGQN
jgi:hypothetical protein